MKKFETRDHELASTLVTLGHEIDSLRWEKEKGKPFGIFVFAQEDGEIHRASNEFFTGAKVMVSPKDLFANHKKLRTWLYDSRDRLKKNG